MKKLKILSVALAIAMSTSALAGCGSGDKKAQSDPKAQETKSEQKVEKKKDPVTLTVEVFDRANAPKDGGTCDNNFMTKWINDKFGAPRNVTVKYVPVPRAQEVEKLNVLLASGNAPDICFTYQRDLFLTYSKQGGLTDVTELYNKTKYLKDFLGNVNDSCKYEGKYLAVAAKRSMTGANTTFIRKDWLEKLNMPVPTNVDEFYQTLKAFKEKNPGKVDTVVPFGLSQATPGDYINQFGAIQLIWSFVKGASDEDLKTLPHLMLPGWKDGVRFVNKLYNEGLIDKEFALDQNQTKLKAQFTTGKLGVLTDGYDFIYSKNKGELIDALIKNVPDAKVEAVEIFKNSEGKYPKYVNGANGLYLLIPKTSKNAAVAIEYLDWMCDPEVGKVLNWGIENEHYKIENGIPVTINPDKVKKELWNFGDLALMYNGPFAPEKEQFYKILAAQTANYRNWGEEVVKSLKMSEKDGFIDFAVSPPFERAIAASTKYQGNLTKMYIDGMAKCIMAKPADFDKTYDALLAEYLKNGGQEVIDEKKAAYKEMKK
ncbi:MAG: extracellular solute-binding protein [Clostridia bacterium]|nr:extracellular solute-binding protein [Clostridia bacterium]